MEVLVLRLGGHRKARYLDTVNVLWRTGNQGNSEEYEQSLATIMEKRLKTNLPLWRLLLN